MEGGRKAGKGGGRVVRSCWKGHLLAPNSASTNYTAESQVLVILTNPAEIVWK